MLIEMLGTGNIFYLLHKNAHIHTYVHIYIYMYTYIFLNSLQAESTFKYLMYCSEMDLLQLE